MPAMASLSSKLIEVAALDLLQPIGNRMQRGIVRRMVTDRAGRPLSIGIMSLEARTVSLRPEAGEVDFGLVSCVAANETDR